MAHVRRSSIVLLALATACASPLATSTDDEVRPSAGGKADGAAAPLPPSVDPEAACPDLLPAGPTQPQGFDRWGSGRLGSPRHALHEPVVQLGEAFTLEARFRYGLASIDLKEELVAAFVRRSPCAEWTDLGTVRLDEDGHFAMEIDPSLFHRVGPHSVEIVVLGDLSRARGHVHVVRHGQPSVVFDIDGTLTTSDAELFFELYDGMPAAMYEGAPDVAWLFADAGYLVVYLTGRPHMLQDMSRRWLEGHGFPLGPVITGDHLLETTAPLVVTHKRGHLDDLAERAGLVFPYAYGNASSDVCAYAESGIDPATTFIIGEHGGEACEGYAPTAAIEDYPTHLGDMDDVPAVWE